MLLTHHRKSDRLGYEVLNVQKAEFYNIGKRHELCWALQGIWNLN